MASDHETIFTMEATPVKFGSGASADAGWELKRHRARPARVADVQARPRGLRLIAVA